MELKVEEYTNESPKKIKKKKSRNWIRESLFDINSVQDTNA